MSGGKKVVVGEASGVFCVVWRHRTLLTQELYGQEKYQYYLLCCRSVPLENDMSGVLRVPRESLKPMQNCNRRQNNNGQ